MDVIAEARERGFELEGNTFIDDGWVWGWSRGDDDRWRCFHERRVALSWMESLTAVSLEEIEPQRRDALPWPDACVEADDREFLWVSTSG